MKKLLLLGNLMLCAPALGMIRAETDFDIRRNQIVPQVHKFSPQECFFLDAAFHGDTERCAALIEAGVNRNIIDERGHSALHRACSLGFSETIRFLVNSGISVHATDNEGNTPLHFLLFEMSDCLAPVRKELIALTVFLVSRGSNLLAQNAQGKTPLSLVKGFDRRELLRATCDNRELRNLL